jgi:3-phosphoshikimate 1-carboxyvinyltransferase
MTTAFRVSVSQPKLSGTIVLEPSKSLSNRALIIQSLCDQRYDIHHLSTSDDTKVLQNMLGSEKETLYSGHAGSSYRFMMARACLMDREVVLDASPQLQRRPIGPLVRALQLLGADINYVNKEGFPPVRIKPSPEFGTKTHEITLQSGVSSQYVTALLLIAPLLPRGMTIHLTEEPVSASYIQMTLSMMQYFGIACHWTDRDIRVEPGQYLAKPYTVEGDWSAASYYYSMVALAENADISIEGLDQQSIQGDAVVQSIYESMQVETIWKENGIHLLKKNGSRIKEFNYDFSLCPDIAQTVMVTMAGLGITGKLSGLKTLRIKETDRLAAMQTELARVKTTLEIKESKGNISCILTGKAKWKDRAKFETYEDHRMAMALTPLACVNPIIIKDPDVVSKSYPGFWKDAEMIGVKSERIKLKS